ncbi:MAG: hypothetical protein ACR2NM_11185 [Bythopirellula sp.]
MRISQRLSNTLSFARKPQVEALEPRWMLSTVPPTVADVAISSSAWDQTFLDYLETSGLGDDGYSIPVGSLAQSQPLPWSDLDRISITFSEDVDVQAGDLSVTGVTSPTYAIDHFFYDPQNLRATWTLTDPFAEEDRLHLDLDGDGIDPVQDLDGNVLDGDWYDELSVYNSGNGTAGGDFEFRFNVLQGDHFTTGLVDYYDFYSTYFAVGLSTTDPGYDPMYDSDGDGLIETSDWQAVSGNLWASLPVGTPTGVTSDAPTTSGFDLASITDRVNETRISLHNVFEDLEDTDTQLSYTVESQSDPSLYDSVTIDAGTGEIVLDAAAVGSGRNQIVVSATDSSGIAVTATLTADLDHTNAAPSIDNFTAIFLGNGEWQVTGTVEDNDDLVEGFLVDLSGLFSGRAAVEADGTFAYTSQVGALSGNVLAQTADPHDEQSGLAIVFVGV